MHVIPLKCIILLYVFNTQQEINFHTIIFNVRMYICMYVSELRFGINIGTYDYVISRQ